MNKQILTEIGVTKAFFPSVEPESGVVLLRSRRPAMIQDGRLTGSEFALAGNTFRVWTSQTKKARAIAKTHGLRIRELTGECELYIPAVLADAVLPQFGAKVKRSISEVERVRLRALAANLRSPRTGLQTHDTPKTWKGA